MNEKKRRGIITSGRGFILFFIISSILFGILLSLNVGAICYLKSDQTCYTADADVRQAQSDRASENQFCSFTQPNTYACQDEREGYCCSTSVGALGLHGYVARDRTSAFILRTLYASGAKRDTVQLQCFPGTLAESGSCSVSQPINFVNIENPEGSVGNSLVAGQDGFCNVGQIGCQLDSLALGTLACCATGQGLQVNLESASLKTLVPDQRTKVQQAEAAKNEFLNRFRSAFNPNIMDPLFRAPGGQVVCGPQQAVCGIKSREGIYCCDLEQVRVTPENEKWVITPAMRGDNQFCYPNEVICGVDVENVWELPRDPFAGFVTPINNLQSQLFSTLNILKFRLEPKGVQCCEVFSCQPRPDCSLPERDNNCNGVLDGLDPVCADSDFDRVKDADDQCVDTPRDERADEHGCSPSQKDSDGDGIKDNADRCSNTPQDQQVEHDGCPSAIAQTRQACEARREAGLLWFGPDQGGSCCGDQDGEYFILQSNACVGSGPLEAGRSGGGFGGRHLLADLQSPGIKGNSEQFLTVTERSHLLGLGEFPDLGEDEEGPERLIRIRRNPSNIPYLNQYTLEYLAEVDGSRDESTQFHLNIVDRFSDPIYRKTVGPTHMFPNGQRVIQDTFEISRANEVEIFVRKSGTGTVKIGNLALYSSGNRQILFTGTDFLFCRNPGANQLLEGGIRAFERTDPQEGPLTNDNNLRTACQGAPNSGFVCDTDGQWRDQGAIAHVQKSLPSEDQLQEIGINLAFRRVDQPNVRQIGCCLPDQCWDGGECVEANAPDAMLGLREVQAGPADREPRNIFVCALDEAGTANWIAGQRKFDQYLITSSFCSANQCWFNGERQSPPSSSKCENPGEKHEAEGIFCDNGAWKTKLSALVEAMLIVKDRSANPNQYSLYCDDIHKVLLDKPDETAFWAGTQPNIFTGKEKACILEYNHATWLSNSLVGRLLSQIFAGKTRNTVVGILLEGEEQITDKIASEPERGPQENICSSAKASDRKNQFLGCDGARPNVFEGVKLYFNKDLNALIYSKSENIRVKVG